MKPLLYCFYVLRRGMTQDAYDDLLGYLSCHDVHTGKLPELVNDIDMGDGFSYHNSITVKWDSDPIIGLYAELIRRPATPIRESAESYYRITDETVAEFYDQ